MGEGKWGRRIRESLARGEAGVSAIEYALLASLIAMAIIITVVTLSSRVRGIYNNVAKAVNSSSGS